MAHFAEIKSEDNLVIRAVVISDQDCVSHGGENSAELEQWVASITRDCVILKQEFGGVYPNTYWKRTSYNTYEGVHLKGGTPFRKNFAAIGGSYDATLDAFIPRKLYASWTLNTSTCIWEAPVDYPTADGGVPLHAWNEDVYQADTGNPKTKGWVTYNVEGETP